MNIAKEAASAGGRAAVIDESRWRSRREARFTWLAILFTLATTVMVLHEQGPLLLEQLRHRHWSEFAAHLLFLSIVALLVYGGLVYLVTRLGYIQRLSRHQPASREGLERLLRDEQLPLLTVLVPSYKEERGVIYQTLMSAALQEYPRKRVVLLIDDAPNPATAADMAQLAAARELPLHIASLLAAMARRIQMAHNTFLIHSNQQTLDPRRESGVVVELWQHAADWFACRASEHNLAEHVERLFVEQVLQRREERCRARGGMLDEQLRQGGVLSVQGLEGEYRELSALFDCELSSFERKRYINLSHEPNKAMNLNSYIHLSGKTLRERQRQEGRWLEECDAEVATLSVPESDYFITLDADSILLPEYALRLIEVMERPQNGRMAVAQTPYSAFPGAVSPLERIAGATTDMQYIIHQGFTRHNATYWVGANALLRWQALKEIAENGVERGYPITRYIQDRTVIEDTESSVDLAARGWALYNYPQRLAYSATPPDFGSLVIQRRRWANGGLIILPKLLGYLLCQPPAILGEGLLRLHYLISIAAVNFGLLAMLALPLSASIETFWLPLTALPYFLLYGRDLLLCGYRATDLLRVYALNLLLIPVNIAGVLKSLQQALTRRKIPFGRTPKIKGRTVTPLLYLLAAYALSLSWLIGAYGDLNDGYLAQAAFACVNAVILLYAIATFIGLRESGSDLAAFLRRSAPAPEVEVLPAEGDNVILLREHAQREEAQEGPVEARERHRLR